MTICLFLYGTVLQTIGSIVLRIGFADDDMRLQCYIVASSTYHRISGLIFYCCVVHVLWCVHVHTLSYVSQAVQKTIFVIIEAISCIHLSKPCICYNYHHCRFNFIHIGHTALPLHYLFLSSVSCRCLFFLFFPS